MNHHHRALSIWIDITWAGLPSLVLLSVILGWSPVVRATLMALSVIAVFGTRIAIARGGRTDAARARQRRSAARPAHRA